MSNFNNKGIIYSKAFIEAGIPYPNLQIGKGDLTWTSNNVGNDGKIYEHANKLSSVIDVRPYTHITCKNTGGNGKYILLMSCKSDGSIINKLWGGTSISYGSTLTKPIDVDFIRILQYDKPTTPFDFELKLYTTDPSINLSKFTNLTKASIFKSGEVGAVDFYEF